MYVRLGKRPDGDNRSKIPTRAKEKLLPKQKIKLASGLHFTILFLAQKYNKLSLVLKTWQRRRGP
jgi:hypothetical protein